MAARFLFIVPIYAVTLDMGGGQRTHHLFRSLRELGAVDVQLMSEPAFAELESNDAVFAHVFRGAASVRVVQSSPQFASSPALWRRVWNVVRPRVALYEATAGARAALESRLSAHRYDAIVGRYLQPTAVSGALDQRRVPVVVDLDDIDEMVLRSRRLSPTTPLGRRILLRFHEHQVRRVAKRLWHACAHVFTTTADDLDVVGHPSASVLPNIPARSDETAVDAVRDAGRTDPMVVLFVGSRAHRLNREGIGHFVAHCWPQIHARVPQAELRIVGSGKWSEDQAQLESTAGVRVVGFVPAVDAEYARATICVAPLYEGSGTKIKVLEALMFGRIVLASEQATRGYEHLIGNGLVCSPTDAAMVDDCVRLLQDPAARADQASRGRALVSDEHSFERFRSVVADGLRAVAPAPQ